MTQNKSLLLSRRQTLVTIGFGAGALVLPQTVTAQIAPQAALKAQLAALHLPFTPARVDLLKLTQTRQSQQVQLRALVRLTWAPGTRQQYFTAHGEDQETAQNTLVETIYQRFFNLTSFGVKTA